MSSFFRKKLCCSLLLLLLFFVQRLQAESSEADVQVQKYHHNAIVRKTNINEVAFLISLFFMLRQYTPDISLTVGLVLLSVVAYMVYDYLKNYPSLYDMRRLASVVVPALGWAFAGAMLTYMHHCNNDDPYTNLIPFICLGGFALYLRWLFISGSLVEKIFLTLCFKECLSMFCFAYVARSYYLRDPGTRAVMFFVLGIFCLSLLYGLEVVPKDKKPGEVMKGSAAGIWRWLDTTLIYLPTIYPAMCVYSWIGGNGVIAYLTLLGCFVGLFAYKKLLVLREKKDGQFGQVAIYRQNIALYLLTGLITPYVFCTLGSDWQSFGLLLASVIATVAIGFVVDQYTKEIALWYPLTNHHVLIVNLLCMVLLPATSYHVFRICELDTFLDIASYLPMMGLYFCIATLHSRFLVEWFGKALRYCFPDSFDFSRADYAGNTVLFWVTFLCHLILLKQNAPTMTPVEIAARLISSVLLAMLCLMSGTNQKWSSHIFMMLGLAGLDVHHSKNAFPFLFGALLPCVLVLGLYFEQKLEKVKWKDISVKESKYAKLLVIYILVNYVGTFYVVFKQGWELPVNAAVGLFVITMAISLAGCMVYCVLVVNAMGLAGQKYRKGVSSLVFLVSIVMSGLFNTWLQKKCGDVFYTSAGLPFYSGLLLMVLLGLVVLLPLATMAMKDGWVYYRSLMVVHDWVMFIGYANCMGMLIILFGYLDPSFYGVIDDDVYRIVRPSWESLIYSAARYLIVFVLLISAKCSKSTMRIGGKKPTAFALM